MDSVNSRLGKLPMRPSNALERLRYFNKNSVKNFPIDDFVKLVGPLYDNYRKDLYEMMVADIHDDLFPKFKWAQLR
jgi:hypothetical protein